MQETVGNTAARFVAEASDRSYADEIVDAAKMCLVDWVGVALGAYHEPAAGVLRRVVEAWHAQGEARILLGPKTSPALAALANGTMGHCLDFDDTRAKAASHLSSPTWSATLAVAGQNGASEMDALGAFITGFEVAAGLGGTEFDGKLQFSGFHPTSVFGRFSAAAAAGVLMGLDAEQVAHAFGVAATTAGGLNASFGTMSKPFHSGKAAMDGVLAAELAREGFVAATHLFDAKNGLAGTLVQDGSVCLDGIAFTDGRALLDNSFKPYACGKLIHGHIDSARELRDTIGDRRIVRIHCQVAPIGIKLVGRPEPKTHLEAKFSIAFCVAMALLGYPVFATDFTTERLADPRVRGLMSCVELEINPVVDEFGSIMDITLEDGTCLHAEVNRSLGNPENPLSWEDLRYKFENLVEPVLGTKTEALFQTLRHFDEAGRIKEFMSLVTPP